MESHIKIIESDKAFPFNDCGIMCENSEGGESNFLRNLRGNEEESGEESDSGTYLQCDDSKSNETESPLRRPNSRVLVNNGKTVHPACKNWPLDETQNYFTADSASEDEDSDSSYQPQFLEMSDFSDDERLVQVDHVRTYKHMDSVTKKSWHLNLPERKRIVYFPFYSPKDGSPILARVDTNLQFKKEQQASSTFYVSYLNIFNETNDYITYMVRCSDPQNLILKSPRTGSIYPRGSVSLFIYFKDDPRFMRKLADQGLAIGLTTFNVIGWNGSIFNDTESALTTIERKHYEDLWSMFGTDWFPHAEVHHVNNLRIIGQDFVQGGRKLEKNTKNLKDLLYEDKTSHLEKNLQFSNNVTDGIMTEFRQLQAEMREIKRDHKYNQEIKKAWTLILCAVVIYLLISPTDHVQNVMKLVFGFQELPQNKGITWAWWWPW